ncbi:MAG: hypothetical protein A3H52_03225 [Candidatus Zambryskibacteria bacterium RIFCSPLOWO2_02_FULL_39_26]|uniref:Transposase IS200-like domain-containing protein n=1 Tax=Candidatus Zambryskibacteria bacterium RIFCSPLOWO2_12_FULL_39_23 TaxID=1802776 RepID=A0A1G2USJ4_9BACT|nr:MAG: hypothetical protein A2W51_00340 [Candidatus Zambryskibacteria bacterium RIFCSPHIGHO2_02_39_10]OHA99759.1 MAG: hypothetical protein A3E59_01300 [Candidatus Zambryskibacteria bacterium RIFCSPHIGHO2_12_FULL_39_47]OHB09365.1 MAG: hypothetical protein A3H52_03225 [Candidatus Zambryskibacteria bacterium RIFCSPLOWO2_02_FULL_39_26]OHB12349.1 MAG: hypothetical protein A3G99_00115 [Candidatus Zambryskibacteria bacterium RIFCSPLOWO2_12_FULL_39_23]
MSQRKTDFVTGEFYHIYNRGVDKRDIFMDQLDIDRFFQSMEEFNTINPIGSIYENRFVDKKDKSGSKASKSKLVDFIAYCLNPNHYHFILKQVDDKGVEKFMQRIGTGFAKYFNNRQKRSGSLFQGKFKSKHINSNEYLLHLSVYVNQNNNTKLLGSKASKLSKSSWSEYINNSTKEICNKEIILEQFKNINEYEEFSISSLSDIIERKSKNFDFD